MNYIDTQLGTTQAYTSQQLICLSSTKDPKYHLPQHLKLLVNDAKCFKIFFKWFLYHHSFYSVEEYYEHNEDKDM
jgi:hypothetical protein